MLQTRFARFVMPTFLFSAWLAGGAVTAAGPVRGVTIEPPKQLTKYTLTDQDGRPAVFPAGGWQLVFFGFTHCPDVCPVTLHKATQVMALPGPKAAALQVTFISIDPEHDKPDVIRHYVSEHGGGIQGLAGDLVSTQKVGSEFEIVVRRYQDRESGAPRFEHSSFLYLLDPQGRLVMFYPATVEASGIAEDIARLAKPGK